MYPTTQLGALLKREDALFCFSHFIAKKYIGYGDCVKFLMVNQFVVNDYLWKIWLKDWLLKNHKLVMHFSQLKSQIICSKRISKYISLKVVHSTYVYWIHIWNVCCLKSEWFFNWNPLRYYSLQVSTFVLSMAYCHYALYGCVSSNWVLEKMIYDKIHIYNLCDLGELCGCVLSNIQM